MCLLSKLVPVQYRGYEHGLLTSDVRSGILIYKKMFKQAIGTMILLVYVGSIVI